MNSRVKKWTTWRCRRTVELMNSEVKLELVLRCGNSGKLFVKAFHQSPDYAFHCKQIENGRLRFFMSNEHEYRYMWGAAMSRGLRAVFNKPRCVFQLKWKCFDLSSGRYSLASAFLCKELNIFAKSLYLGLSTGSCDIMVRSSRISNLKFNFKCLISFPSKVWPIRVVLIWDEFS